MEAHRAQYLRAIEERFIELRRRGVMLSPRDVHLVDSWRERGVPLRLVLGVLEEGVRTFRQRNAPGTPVPGALAYFEPMIEQAIALRRDRLLGSPPAAAEPAHNGADPGTKAAAGGEAVLDALLAAVERDGRQLESEPAREVLRDVWRALKAARERAEDEDAAWRLTEELGRRMVDGLVATLSEDERAALDDQAASAVAQSGGRAMSERAKEDRGRVEHARLVRERFGVGDLMEVLLDHSDG